jgi:hypothetical protein
VIQQYFKKPSATTIQGRDVLRIGLCPKGKSAPEHHVMVFTEFHQLWVDASSVWEQHVAMSNKHFPESDSAISNVK